MDFEKSQDATQLFPKSSYISKITPKIILHNNESKENRNTIRLKYKYERGET